MSEENAVDSLTGAALKSAQELPVIAYKVSEIEQEVIDRLDKVAAQMWEEAS